MAGVTLESRLSGNDDLVQMTTCSQQAESSCRLQIYTGRSLLLPPSQL